MLRWSIAAGIFLLFAIPAQVSAYNVCDDGGACTHEAMTRQALDIFFTDDPDFPTDLRKEILYGAEDPDEYELFYGCGGVGDALVTCSHLWDADKSLGTAFVLSGKPYANAFQAAQTLWTRALGAYANGEVEKAYRYLGMIAHFLGDQTIPAHAHNDRHPAVTGDGDYYEVTMSLPKQPTDCILKYPSPGPERDACIVQSSKPFTGGYYAELSISEANSLKLKGILNPPETITETDRKFLWLLLSTNQVADLFPSDDFNGDDSPPSDPEFPAAIGWIDDVMTQTYRDLNPTRLAEVTACNNDTVPRFENTPFKEAQLIQDGKSVTTCTGMFDLIREISYMRGIRALAGLFELWQESIKQPILMVTMIRMTELEEGDDDTGLFDGTDEDDFYVGMVFGTNKKVHEQDCGPKGTNYCEYLPASFLLDLDGDRRKVDGAFLASNTTRRDADPYLFEDGYGECLEDLRDDMCFDAEGQDTINPLYRFGQVYDPGVDGTYDAGDDVEFRVYGWDADAESPAEWLFDADDLLDINGNSGANILKFRVDLDKCFMNDGSGDDGVKVEGFNANDCGGYFEHRGRGGQNNDTAMQLSVRFENILDDDDDGVPNILDVCPNTPPNTVVNARGCPNTAPVATNDAFIVLEDGVLNGNVISGDNGNGVDNDADGDGLSIVSSTMTSNGVVAVTSSTGAFTYTPAEHFCGVDSFTYQLWDFPSQTPPQKVSNTATVSITVTCVNDPPVANDDDFIIQEDELLNGNVISADNGNGADVEFEGDAMSIETSTEAMHGLVAMDAATGAFSYQPNENYCGPDSFTYQLSDDPPITPPAESSNTATVSITVDCVNDSPKVTAVSPPTQEVDYRARIVPVFITVVDVDDGATLLNILNLPPQLARSITLDLVGCTPIVTESYDEDGSTCVWVFDGFARYQGGPLDAIVFRAADDDGPGSQDGMLTLIILPVPIPTLSNWALLVLALLMLAGFGYRHQNRFFSKHMASAPEAPPK